MQAAEMGRQQSDLINSVMCETKHSMKAMHAPMPSKPQHTNTLYKHQTGTEHNFINVAMP